MQHPTWTDRPWIRLPLGGFDTETTGLDPTRERIVTACVMVVDDSTVSVRTWLLNPGIEIPEEAARVHGITTDRAAAEGMDYGQGLGEIRDALNAAWREGRAMAAYNAAYDVTIISSELARLGMEPLAGGLLVDPLVIDRACDPDRVGRRRLTDAVRHYGLTMGTAHTADADTLAAIRLAWVLGRKFPEVGRLNGATLGQMQIGWYRDQAEALRQRFANLAADKRRRAEQILVSAAELESKAAGVKSAWPLQRA
ncbi:exonuclease domain-containing protein [Nocardia sp. FBN12]|uniref:exonuclease domain-containing protein n=1 Tax=Nocardia sp. FBN12 TaxID=3419766 RepID=UPI003D030A53